MAIARRSCGLLVFDTQAEIRNRNYEIRDVFQEPVTRISYILFRMLICADFLSAFLLFNAPAISYHFDNAAVDFDLVGTGG